MNRRELLKEAGVATAALQSGERLPARVVVVVEGVVVVVGAAVVLVVEVLVVVG